MTDGTLSGYELRADGPPPSAVRPRTTLSVALEQTRNRLMVTAAMVALAFTAISAKLVDATVLRHVSEPKQALVAEVGTLPVARADITDRNGNLLATSLATASLYADPKLVIDPKEAARKLVAVLPELDLKDLTEKLSSGKRFIWIKRNLTPKQHFQVFRLGIPGVYFEREERRFYPTSNLTSHVVGFTGVDNNGLAGMEQGADKRLRTDPRPLQLSLDLRLQHILRKELAAATEEFRALGAAGMIYDVRNGEVLAMVSLPDFDPHDPTGLDENTLFNRNTLGVYEMGSTFKIFNSAMALDSGKVRLADSFDASHSIQIGRFTISDYHGKNRWLTVPEIFQYSSNIGSVRMALQVGVQAQKAFMTKMGFMRPTAIELPENGWPLVPNPWREINAMTISFGHGISVSPMHTIAAAAGMINGGIIHPPTILKRDPDAEVPGERVISDQTSRMMRKLFRLVVTDGSAKSAEVKGYVVGGKTGTADKQKGRSYSTNARLSSFVGAFPMHDPRYIVFVMVDEPKATAKTFGYATGGWVAAPAVSRVIRQIGPLLNVPVYDETLPEIRNAVDLNPPAPAAPIPTKAAAASTKGSTVASVPTLRPN
ncbi:penicillin-binding protein 2 [Azospirillum sp. RWY-5-1]|uniref:Penicillin-binding protein 2 n=1 Tax=Azospirillum oleiclasticum TaxID=2735135 RepID=A0ABX2TCT3_9PROT|nr:penicillin-binding protein 2 [Azospirillum oleiclasticum]NYZ15714.1 penicillin-binding protein 2 [Azospirillum oleiclasticum]NYZ21984.1 penicillin-binding protein 2 [Azospirillum oleiclasticum]